MKFSHLYLAILMVAVTAHAADKAAFGGANCIPWNQIVAKASADYKGDGFSVTAIDSGARLHCTFQRLDGEVAADGLWLTSTASKADDDRFRVIAVAVGRKDSILSNPLSGTGKIVTQGQTVRFVRPGLTEEYSVSMDGIRQDFVVEPPLDNPRAGELVVRLTVNGANVEQAPGGAQLVLEKSGRKIAYNRLRATDATGRELPARIEVFPVGDEVTSLKPWDFARDDIKEMSLLTSAPTNVKLSVVVEDTDAVYPIRIDPTFSDANWISLGGLPGVNGSVNAAVSDSAGNLYIGGSFSIVGSIIASNIAKWDGTNWSPLGAGISGFDLDAQGTYVSAMAVSGNTLYVGGAFGTAGATAANSVAEWNGSNWLALGSGVTGQVNALALVGTNIYAGGSFFTDSGPVAQNIARWNGTSWVALKTGLNNTAYALAVSGSMLYVGGSFTTAGSSNANNIAQWNGTNWSALGSGLNSQVSALAVSGSSLYVGGLFTNAGGSPANYVAQWNGSNWSSLGSGMNSAVNALAVAGNTLYAGGQFTNAGGSAISCVAQWNGSGWSGLDSGISGVVGRTLSPPSVFTLAVSGSTLYAGGYYAIAGGGPANSFAQWNGTNWSALAPGMNNIVRALAVSGGTLYAGGAFTSAGTTAANYVAQWNGTNWSALGSGMDSFVTALAVSGGTLYAGGQFTNAGGSAANYIAQWNGTNWSPLGLGMNNRVQALVVAGNRLYAGGQFTNAGGNPASFIAQWDGTNWSALGLGVNLPLVALAASGNKLYAGSGFTMAGGIPVNYIAQWDGSSWSALGSGMDNFVNALATSGSTLYAGGAFTNAGGNVVNNVARWDGTAWHPLGSGVNNNVQVLAVSGSTLYAGGNFTSAGGSPANYIAQWNGNDWSAMGSGVGGGAAVLFVESLAVCGNTLYAGGSFTTAGTNVSGYVAEAVLPLTISILTTDGNFGLTNGLFGFNISGPSGSNVIIQASADLQSWTPLQTNQFDTNGLFYFSDSQPPSNTQRFYRAQLSP